MATKKMTEKTDPYSMSLDEPEDQSGTYTVGGGRKIPVKPNEELHYDKKKGAYVVREKKTQDSKIPSEAMEVIRQKAKDAAYEEGEKERKKSMSTPFAKGGSVGSASRRADGCAAKGKTKGKMV